MKNSFLSRWFRSLPLRQGIKTVFLALCLLAGVIVLSYSRPPTVNATSPGGNQCQSNVVSGSWNVSGSWTSCGGTTPQSTDSVEIKDGDTITDTVASTTVARITIDSGGIFVISGSNALTIDGNYSFGGVASTGWINSGTFTANQSTVSLIHPYTYPAAFLSGTMTGSSAFYNLSLNDDESVVVLPFVISANLAVTNNLAIGTDGSGKLTGVNDTFSITGNSTGTFTMGSEASINIVSYPTGFTTANTSLDPGSVVEYTAGGTISNTPTYGSLELYPSSSSYTLSLTGNTVVAGQLEIFTDTLDTAGYNMLIAGNYVNGGTFTAETGTVTMNGTGSQTLSGTMTGSSAFYNLTFNGIGGIWTFGTTSTISNNLTVTNGTVSDGAYQITGNGTGMFTMASGTTLKLGGGSATSFPTNFSTANTTLNGASTVVYNATVAQTISGTPTYGNLQLSAASGTPTKTLAAVTTVTGDLTIDINNTLDVSSGNNYALNLKGSFTNNGLFLAQNGTVTFNATVYYKTLAGTMTGSSAFYNLTFNGSGGDWDISNDIAITNNLAITHGTVEDYNSAITGNSTGTFTMGSGTGLIIGETASTFPTNFTNAHITLNTASTVDFGTDSDQTISSVPTYGNLVLYKQTLGGSSTKTLTGNTVVTGNLSINQGLGQVVTVDTSTYDLTVDGNISNYGTMSSSGSGTITVNGDFTGGGTVNFSANTVNQRIGTGQNFGPTDSNGWTFYNLTFSNSGSSSHTIATETSGSAGVTVNNNLTIGSGGDTGATVLDAGNITWTMTANSETSLTANGSSSLVGDASTFVYTGADSSASTGYYNLTLAPSSGSSQQGIAYAPYTIGGNLVVGDGTHGGASGPGFPVIPTMNVAGNVTISANAEFLPASYGTITVSGSWTNNGILDAEPEETFIFNATSTGNTISGNLSGSSAFSNLTFDGIGGSWTINSPMTVLNNLAINNGVVSDGGNQITGNSSDTFTMGAGATLKLGGASATTFPATFTTSNITLDPASTVIYEAIVNQAISNVPTYGAVQLSTISGAPTRTLTGATTIVGSLRIDANNALDTTSNNYAINLAGDFVNNGTFVANNGTVTFSGTSGQSISGNETSGSAFYNLVVANNSGVVPNGCEITSYVPSVSFANSATISHNYVITTSGAKIQYQAGSIYNVANVDWSGASGANNNIYFRNSDTSNDWQLNVSGTQTAGYVNVSRSDASGGSAVAATSTSNTDCGNNTNWQFLALPNDPGILTQTTGTGAALTAGGETTETVVNLGATVSDQNSGTSLLFCVEVEPVDVPFTNTTTQCSSTVTYAGTPLLTSVTVPNLAVGSYHWQAQAKDLDDNYSDWVPYGTNPETAADFIITRSVTASSASSSTTSASKTASISSPSPSSTSTTQPVTPSSPASIQGTPSPTSTQAGDHATTKSPFWQNWSFIAAAVGSGFVLLFVLRLIILGVLRR